jgi:hypothetical protein
LSMGLFDQTQVNRDWLVNASNRELMRSCYPEVGR